MAPHKIADCVDCRINRRIRELVKPKYRRRRVVCFNAAELRAFCRNVVREARKELRDVD